MFLLYRPRLPIHAQVTVRYLVPIVPMLVILIIMLPSVRTTIHEAGSIIAWTTATVALIGTQLSIALLVILQLTRGEAMQLYGMFAASIGILTGLTFAYKEWRPDRITTVAGVMLGLAVGTGAMFIILSGLVFFSYGDYLF
ncbi:MAG: hypothetical protein ABEJ27_01890, partial [Halodesulfurarchaeum sp.]